MKKFYHIKKKDSHPILADYETDQFSIRINDKGNDIIVKPLNSFSFKSVTPCQTKFKTLSKNTINLFINNLSYLMILILQVMTTNIYIPEIQNKIHLFSLITPYMTKLKLTQISQHQCPPLLTNLPQQKLYNRILALRHIVHKLYQSMMILLQIQK